MTVPNYVNYSDMRNEALKGPSYIAKSKEITADFEEKKLIVQFRKYKEIYKNE